MNGGLKRAKEDHSNAEWELQLQTLQGLGKPGSCPTVMVLKIHRVALGGGGFRASRAANKPLNRVWKRTQAKTPALPWSIVLSSELYPSEEMPETPDS